MQGERIRFAALTDTYRRVVERYAMNPLTLNRYSVQFTATKANADHHVTVAVLYLDNESISDAAAIRLRSDRPRPEVGYAIALGRALDAAGFRRLAVIKAEAEAAAV